MKARLEVTRIPPHFIRFCFLLVLEPGIENVELHISTGITINKMTRDEEEGIWIIDYTVPLHVAKGSVSYLLDDMILIQTMLPTQKLQGIGNVRLSIFKDDLTFHCTRNFPIEVVESGSW